MKTLGRILIILMVFAVVMGITYAIVNAGSASTSANMPAFGRDGERGPMPDGEQPQFANGQRPEFRDGERNEFGEGRGGSRWIFGFVKNIGIVAIIVALFIVLKKLVQRKPTPIPTA